MHKIWLIILVKMTSLPGPDLFVDKLCLFRYNKGKQAHTPGGWNKTMEENKKPQEQRTDFRKTNDANRVLLFRVVGIGAVLYWLLGIIKAYVAGGPDAPSLLLVIVAVILMGGGAIFVAYLTYLSWKKAKEEAVMSEEEVAEMEALRAGDAPAEGSETEEP